ncbi:MAG: pectinesterase family protein, partial [Terriglobales bacterium]
AANPAGGPCRPAREYFDRCWIAGNVDFIFGGGRAWFERCQIRARAHSIVLVTAQSKRYPAEDSGFVFDRCRLTAAPGARRIFLGRPWRRWAWVAWLRCWLPAQLAPAGWREWRHGGRASLPTAYYAEFDSRGPGADPAGREPYARQLTARQAARLTVIRFLHGWNPAAPPAAPTALTEARR